MRFIRAFEQFITVQLSPCVLLKDVCISKPKNLFRMKKTVFMFATIATIVMNVSCKKENAETKVKDTPKTEIPDSYVGKWEAGDFDMTRFWSFTLNSETAATNT